MRRRVVQRRQRRPGGRVAGAGFDSQGPLPYRRQHDFRGNHLGDFLRQAKAIQSGRRQHDRVKLTLVELAQPRLDIAADVEHHQVWPGVQQLRPAAQTAGADCGLRSAVSRKRPDRG